MSPMKRYIVSYLETYKQIYDWLIWQSYNENEEIFLKNVNSPSSQNLIRLPFLTANYYRNPYGDNGWPWNIKSHVMHALNFTILLLSGVDWHGKWQK